MGPFRAVLGGPDLQNRGHEGAPGMYRWLLFHPCAHPHHRPIEGVWCVFFNGNIMGLSMPTHLESNLIQI